MSGIMAQNSGRHTGLVKASSGGGGVWNLILTQTASADSTISFTSGIDSTYDEYVFKFINIHPSADDQMSQFNLSIDGGSNYNVANQSSFFRAYHYESGSSAALSYQDDDDLALATTPQQLVNSCSGNDNDQSMSGYLHLYSLSDTTFVKHFIGQTNYSTCNDTTTQNIFAGYANTASAINAVQFSMSGGNIDSGTISLFGIS